jgi:serine protease Do
MRGKKIMNKMKYFLFGSLLIVASLMVPSCSGLTIPSFNNNSVTTITRTVVAPSPTWTAPHTTTALNTGLASSNAVYLPDLQSVVARVKPSVVAINVQLTSYDYFNRVYNSEAAGSGWILDADGLIATNNHVIDGATSIMVTFDDGSVLPATVVGTDPVSDLAVIKVNKTGLPEAMVGDSSSLHVGQWVLAIGNALGEGISATEGIVSRTGATITADSGQQLSDLIQTSAAVNPGNSGGPLVDLAGNVVGITSAKLADIGVEGMGYAISTKTALPILETLIRKGYVTYPYFGVQSEDVNQVYTRWYNLAVNQGAFVTTVGSGTPAAQCGIKPGDVIVGFDGKNITSSADLTNATENSQVGKTVTIVFYRGSTKNTVQIELVESPVPGKAS